MGWLYFTNPRIQNPSTRRLMCQTVLFIYMHPRIGPNPFPKGRDARRRGRARRRSPPLHVQLGECGEGPHLAGQRPRQRVVEKVPARAGEAGRPGLLSSYGSSTRSQARPSHQSHHRIQLGQNCANTWSAFVFRQNEIATKPNHLKLVSGDTLHKGMNLA